MPQTNGVTADTQVQDLPLSLLDPNPWNRKQFDPELFKDLVLSIRTSGILEPLVVRPVNGRYQIASGNRRFLAAKEIGLERVPCQIMSLTDAAVQDYNLIANIQREDINPIEKAQMITQMMERMRLNQDQMAAHLGKTRVWLT